MSIYRDVIELEQLFFEATEEERESIESKKEEILSIGLEKLCKIRANKISRIEALRTEETRLIMQRKNSEKNLESLENYIMLLLQKAGGKAEAGTFLISKRRSERVDILDQNLIPKEYINEKVTYSPDKKKIKDDINNGVIIDGVAVIDNFNLQIK